MTGVKKEIRTLAWPAIAVVAATMLPALWPSLAGETRLSGGWPVEVAVSAFVVGTALLVALPFGTEFQQRTLGLILSQPVSRGRVWGEKWAASAGVLVVVAAFLLGAFGGTVLDGPVGLRESSFLLALACSGFLWTLVAGSTIGGAAFSLAALALVEMASSVITSRVTGVDLDPFAAHPALISVRLAYCVVTLWLGWRVFSRYEMKGLGESPGVLAAAALAAVPALRCRPTGAISNLVRKELRLQQPTVLIAALFVLCWLAAMLLFSMPSIRPAVAEIVFATLFVSYVPLVLIVCGTISIGEDTSLGIRPWHLTLPVSSRKQWAVKLGVTVAVGAAVGVALPLALKLVTPAFVTLPAGTIQLPPAGRIAAAAGALVVISFWSAALFGHTVKAAVATGVVVPALWVSVVLAILAGQRLGIASGWLTDLMIANQWSPEDLLPMGTRYRRVGGVAEVAVWMSSAALVLLALRQSLSAFRTSQTDGRRIVRYGLQLALAAATVSFIPAAYGRAAFDQYRSQPVRELQAALNQISAASLAAGGEIPAAISAAELEATGELSEDSRRWLAESRIRLHASAPRTTPAGQVRYVRTDVTFASGSTFTMLYVVP